MALRFALIGLGHFGKHYLRLLQDMDGVRLRAVASHRQESLTTVQGLSPDVIRTSDIEMVFNHGEIDCVVIATPASTHFDLASRALKAGKHVLVEKPMTKTFEEAKQFRDAVEKSDRVFMVAHQYCYNDYIRHLKKEIDAGMLGKIRYFFFEHFYPGPIRSDIGCFGDAAPHAFSVLDMFFPETKIGNIQGKMLDISGRGNDDFAAIEISYDNGLLAVLAVSCFAPVKVRRMYMGGEKGMALFDDMADAGKIKIAREPYPDMRNVAGGRSYAFDSLAANTETPAIQAREPLRNQLEHFIECVRAGKTPLTDIAHGIRVTDVIERVYREVKIYA